MRLASRVANALRSVGIAVLVLVSVWAVVELVDRVADRLGGPATAAAPRPPPGADDSLNQPIFVEGGTFLRGSHHPGKSSNPGSPFYTGDEDPVRRTRVESFWMQEHELTNEEYRRFDSAHEFPSGHGRHPVVNVTWREAMAYARSAGGRLATEWEWEYAAEGTDNRTYPWGDAPPKCDRAHYGECEPPGTIEVMNRPAGATPAGVHDLAGNVREWVMPAWFEPGRTPVNDETRRMRGGSFADAAFFLRASYRSKINVSGYENPGLGFRVVWPAEGGAD